MSIWAIADLHLAFAVPTKTMEIFGPRWKGYSEKIERNWRAHIAPDDLVLIPGGISWAKYLEDALIDLRWIDSLPGTKVMLRGNHDYWWSSLNKMQQVFSPTLHAIHNNAFNWQGITIGGSRLWDTPEYEFGNYMENQMQAAPQIGDLTHREAEEKIFKRELQRLELSLQALDPNASFRIAMTHYPPIGADLKPSQASAILEKHRINICVFGHLHNVKYGALPFGTKGGVDYHLVAGDYRDFQPLKIY